MYVDLKLTTFPHKLYWTIILYYVIQMIAATGIYIRIYMYRGDNLVLWRYDVHVYQCMIG